jgi:hypothetical protein
MSAQQYKTGGQARAALSTQQQLGHVGVLLAAIVIGCGGTFVTVAAPQPASVRNLGTDTAGTAADQGAVYPDAVTATPGASSIGFAGETIGSTSPQTMVATFHVAGYSGAFTPTAAMHYGHDYTVSVAKCTKLTATTETCKFSVKFQPTLPGVRKDALVVSDGATALATVLVYGIGEAPMAALNPGEETQVAFPEYAYDSVVDENGTVYTLDAVGNAVYSYKSGGTPTKLPITGLASPHGIAIDGAGTLYIAQNAISDQIITYTAAGAQGTITLLPPPPYAPCSTVEFLYSVAVDGAGNLFALELECNQVFELKTDGSYATTAIDPLMTQPAQLALDANDDVFIGGYTINELTAAGTQTQINAVGALQGIAVDSSGIVYATRYEPTGMSINVGVAELQPSNYATATIGLEPGNFDVPTGLGLGSNGTAYVGDYTNIDIINRNKGALSFGEQTVGVASTAQAVQLVNIGNQPLTISSIKLDETHGYSIESGTLDCTAGIVLAPGSYCQAYVVLKPTHAGNWNDSLIFISNSLNNDATSQSVALSGLVYGPYITASPTKEAFGTVTVNNTATATVTLKNNGLNYPAVFTAPTSSNPAFTASLAPNCQNLVPGATCEMTVTFTPTAAVNYSGTIQSTVTSSGGPGQTFRLASTGSGEN